MELNNENIESNGSIHLGVRHGREETSCITPMASDSYLSSWSLTIVTFSLCLGTFLLALDINIIGVAVPKVTAVFDSLDDVAWYGSAYLLTVTAFQPITGFLYKYFSVRATYLTSIIVFEGKFASCVLPTNKDNS